MGQKTECLTCQHQKELGWTVWIWCCQHISMQYFCNHGKTFWNIFKTISCQKWLLLPDGFNKLRIKLINQSITPTPQEDISLEMCIPLLQAWCRDQRLCNVGTDITPSNKRQVLSWAPPHFMRPVQIHHKYWVPGSPDWPFTKLPVPSGNGILCLLPDITETNDQAHFLKALVPRFKPEGCHYRTLAQACSGHCGKAALAVDKESSGTSVESCPRDPLSRNKMCHKATDESSQMLLKVTQGPLFLPLNGNAKNWCHTLYMWKRFNLKGRRMTANIVYTKSTIPMASVIHNIENLQYYNIYKQWWKSSIQSWKPEQMVTLMLLPKCSVSALKWNARESLCASPRCLRRIARILFILWATWDNAHCVCS